MKGRGFASVAISRVVYNEKRLKNENCIRDAVEMDYSVARVVNIGLGARAVEPVRFGVDLIRPALQCRE